MRFYKLKCSIRSEQIFVILVLRDTRHLFTISNIRLQFHMRCMNLTNDLIIVQTALI